MTMSSRSWLTIAGLYGVLAVFTGRAHASDASPPPNSTNEDTSALKWLSDNVSIAKTFTGTSKDEHAPASIAYENASPGSSSESVDLAIKGKFKDFALDSVHWSAAPTLEWHRSTLAATPVNKLGAALNLSSWVFLSQYGDFVGTDLQYKVARDFVADNNPNSVVWRVYYHEGSRPGLWPGVHFKPADSEELFYYLPSIGIDHYSKLKLTDTEFGKSVQLAPPLTATFFDASLNFFINIFPNPLESRLTLNADITYRRRLAGDTMIPESSNATDLALTYYFNHSRTVGFGIDYQLGRDPDQNFLNDHKVSIGLKVKL